MLKLGSTGDLIAIDPKQNVLESDLATCRVTEADILRRLHDEAAALRGYKEARTPYDRLAQADARNLDARLNVAATDAKIAAAFVRLGQYDEAQGAYQHAIQVHVPLPVAIRVFPALKPSEAKSALTWKQVRQIVKKFEAVNPYERKVIPGSVLKIEWPGKIRLQSPQDRRGIQTRSHRQAP